MNVSTPVKNFIVVPVITYCSLWGLFKLYNYLRLVIIIYYLIKIKLLRTYYKLSLIMVAMKTIDNIIYIHDKLT
jgi:hypothetical protein